MSRARLLAAHTRESGAWLNALPVSALGLRMDDDTVRVAMGLRLGAPLCLPHVCHHCRAEVGKLGTHAAAVKVKAVTPVTQASTASSRGICLQQESQPTLNPLAYAVLMSNVLMVLRSCPGVVVRVLVWDATCPRHSGPIPYCLGFQRARFGGRTGRAAAEDQVCGPSDHTPLHPHRH